MLTEISKKAHATARKRKQETALSESILHLIEEAIEISKANKFADYSTFESLFTSYNFKYAYELCVKDTIDDELADIIILACSIAEEYGVNLDIAVAGKMKYNEERGVEDMKNIY